MLLAASKRDAMRIISLLTAFIFAAEQILLAAPPSEIRLETTAVPVVAPQAPEDNPDSGSRTAFIPSTQSFLEDTLVLTAPDENSSAAEAGETQVLSVQDDARAASAAELLYDYERYAFEDALDLLRPEYAAAVILESFTAEDAARLPELEFETAVAVIGGEIVLFSTGNKEEIGLLEPARELLEHADFISHTHTEADAQAGPSDFDFLMAIEAPQTEYVLTRRGAYAYNQSGLLDGGVPVSADIYAERLAAAVLSSSFPHVLGGNPDFRSPTKSFGDDMPEKQIRVRALLNEFVRQMDEYNRAPEEIKTAFRRSDPVAFQEAGGQVVIEAEHPYQNITRDKSWTQPGTLAGYSGEGYFFAGHDSGKSWDYPDAQAKSPELKYAVNIQTAGVWYVWVRAYAPNGGGDSLHIGLDGAQSASSDRMYVPATGIGQFYWTNKTMDGSAPATLNIASAGLHTINVLMREDGLSFDKIILTRDPNFVPSGFGPAESAQGENPGPAPVDPPTVETLPAYTNQNTQVLSGTKTAGTSIWINGAEAVAADAAASWTYTAALNADGTHTFSITAKDAQGTESTAVTAAIVRDTAAPAIHVLSAAQVDSAAYTLIYETDGVQKTRQETLAPGANVLVISETDAAGNQTVLEFTVTLDTGETMQTGTDGTQFYYVNNVLVREVTPAGAAIYYRADGSAEKFRYADGREVRFLTDGTIQLAAADGAILENVSSLQPAEPNESQALKLTLENGIEAWYAGSEPVEFRTETGIRITNFTLDAGNNLENALIVYPDRTIEIIRGGALLRRIYPEGSWLDFTPAGFAVREIFTDRTEYYAFSKLSQTSVSQTRIFSSGGALTVYDDKGLLRETRDSSGKHFIYTRMDASDHILIQIDHSASSALEPKGLTASRYSLTGVLEQMRLEEGTVITFAEGRITSVRDAENNEVGYQYLQENGLVSGLRVNREGAQFVYDVNGFLSAIVTGGGTIRRTADDSDGDGTLTDEEIIKLILEEAGGNRLTNFELDGEGRILSGILETKEGIRQRIENGVLTGFETVDGRVYQMQDLAGGGREAVLSEWKFRDGTRIVYGGGSITDILFPDNRRLLGLEFDSAKRIRRLTEQLADGTQKFFEAAGDQPMRLMRTVTPSGAEIVYGREGLAESIRLPDGADQTVSYVRDAAGTIQEVVFAEAHARRTFRPDGTLVSLLTEGVEAEFEGDEVAKLFTRFAASENPPQFDAEGRITGEFKFNDDVLLKVTAGELTEAVRPNGTRVLYSAGRVDSIVMPAAAEGENPRIYRLLYDNAEGGALQNMRIRLESVEGQPELPLVPFLEKPDAILAGLTGSNGAEQPVTFYGDAQIQPAARFGGGAVKLDGAGDYLALEHDPAFAFGADNWTLDFQVRLDQQNSEYAIFRKGDHLDGGIAIHRHAGVNRWDIFVGGNNVLSVNSAMMTGQWHHVALVRDGGTLKFFQDGVLIGSKTVSNNASITNTDRIHLGANQGSFQFFPGQIDELRLSRGARWPTDFTPPAEEYGADADTKLLLHFNPPSEDGTGTAQDAAELATVLLARPLYNSLADQFNVKSIFNFEAEAQASGPHAFTLQGNAQKDTAKRKFGTASLRLDGAGDSMIVEHHADLEFGSDDWTVDTWVRLDQQSGEYVIFRKGDHLNGGIAIHRHAGINRWDIFAGGDNVLSVNSSMATGQWHHVALVRAGGVLKFFQDGVLIGSRTVNNNGLITNTGSLYLGAHESGIQFLPGRLDEMRVSRGARWTSDFTLSTAEYARDENTVLLLHFSDEEFASSSEILPPGEAPEAETQPGHEIFFSKRVLDSERSQSYEFATQYLPEWLNVSLTETGTDGGFIERAVQKGASDNLPDLTAALIDIDGDGLADRVTAPAGADYWLVQKNSGQGFENAVHWNGIDTALNSWTLRETAGPHPIFYTDLRDMNGDGRPDRVITSYNDPVWRVQLNNGAGFDAPMEWGQAQVLSFYTNEGKYAVASRFNRLGGDIQDQQSALIDLDGDGLADRVVRPTLPEGAGAPDHWFFQKNTGTGFADAVIWEGVDAGFYPAHAGVYSWDVPSIGASINWQYQPPGGPYDIFATMGDLADMNGDGRPDRVLLRHQTPGDFNSAFDWYVQLNNGAGFDAAVLWDADVREVPGFTASGGTNNAAMASAIQIIDHINGAREYAARLADVTGDGKPDRVTLAVRPGAAAQTSWWVEINDGTTFLEAVEWTGIDGVNGIETAIGQDNDLYHMNRGSEDGCARVTPCSFARTTDLTDINGDAIPDRVIFRPGQTKWLVQFGTGAGFLPAEEMEIQGLTAESNAVKTSRYDYLHVSLKAAQAITPESGKVHISMGDGENNYQEWILDNLTTDWQDFYLPLDPSRADAAGVRIIFEPAGADPDIPIYIDNMTFTRVRPPAQKDWLNRLLAEESTLTGIHDLRTQDLAQYLGFSEAGEALSFNWDQLLTAETRIEFDETGEAETVETFSGSVSELEGGQVMRTTLTNGTVVLFDPAATPGVSSIQTVIQPGGTVAQMDLTYGRIRSVSDSEQGVLQYSYEFDSMGREIIVVHAPDTGITERYQGELLISRRQPNGLETVYEYDSAENHARTRIIYKGRMRQSFEHGLSVSGNRLVKTDAGIIDEYNAQGQIVAHTTPEGYRFSHSFESARRAVTVYETETVQFEDGISLSVQIPSVSLEENPEVEEIHRIVLHSLDREGVHAEYELEKLTSLVLVDGTQISFERVESVDVTDPETGELNSTIRLLDAAVFHTDGTVTEFRGGVPSRVVSANGSVIDLSRENGLLNSPDESAVFHHAEASKIWNELVLIRWKEFQLPAAFAVQLEYTIGGKLTTRQYAEGTLELYQDGKIQDVLAPDGERLIHYEYDAEGSPVHIQMEGSRRRLDSALARTRAEIAMERERALAHLAEREQVIDETVEGEYRVIRDNLLRIREKIEAQRDQVLAIPVRGKQAREIMGDALTQVQAGLDQVNAALEQLANQRAEALAQLAEQVAAAHAEIEIQTADSYALLGEESRKIRRSILKRELTPVIHHWFRKILGRDPSQTEYDHWIDQANYEAGTFDLASLKSELQSGTELQVRQSEVAAIKANVDFELRRYLALDEAGKLAFARALGMDTGNAVTLSEAEALVSLSQSEVDTILSWLNTRSLHFGQSAFIALETLLDDAGILYNRMDLASQLILIDILTGTISALEQDDLVISLFAMRTYAGKHGLAAQSYAMTFEALQQFYQSECPDPENCNFRLVVHIDSNHYIIVTKVSGTEVHYIDPGAGPERALDAQILIKEEFLRAWLNHGGAHAGFGFVLSPRPPPAEVSADKYRRLVHAEEMSVRGAFFAFLIPVFMAVFTALLITAAVAGILASLTQLLDSFKDFFSGLGDFFKGLFTLNFSKAWEGLKKSFFAHLEIGMTILSSPIIGITKALEVIGVPPEAIETIVSVGKIVAGVMVTPINPALGLGLIAGGTAELLNQYTHLSPAVTSIISIGAAAVGAFAGGFGTGGIEGALALLKTAAPHLLMDFSTAGLGAVGNAIGLDPRITDLISVPVRAAVGSAAGGFFGEGTIIGYRDDGTRIFVSHPADFGDVIGGAIQSAPREIGFNVGSGGGFSDSNYVEALIDGSAANQPGLFSRIFGTLKDSSLSLGNFIGPTAFAAVINQAVNFDQHQLEQGLPQVLQTHAAVLFDRQTIENIVKTEGGINQILARGSSPVNLPDGRVVRGYQFSNTTTLLFDDSSHFLGQIKNGRYELGEFSLRGKEFVLKEGKIVETLSDGGTLEIRVQNEKIHEVLYKEAAGSPIFSIEGGQEPLFIEGPEGKSFWSGVVKFIQTGLEFVYKNGTIVQVLSRMAGEPADAIDVPEGQDEVTDERNRRTYLINGIGNVNPVEDGAPEYMVRLRDILHDSYGFTNMELVGIYQGIDLPGAFTNNVSDFAWWIQQLALPLMYPTEAMQIVSEVMRDIADGIINIGDTINVIAYSGAGQRVIDASWRLPVNINLIGYGTPILAAAIPARIKNIQPIWGTEDELLNIMPFESILRGLSIFSYPGDLLETIWLEDFHHADFPNSNEWGYHSENLHKSGTAYIDFLARAISGLFMQTVN